MGEASLETLREDHSVGFLRTGEITFVNVQSSESEDGLEFRSRSVVIEPNWNRQEIRLDETSTAGVQHEDTRPVSVPSNVVPRSLSSPGLRSVPLSTSTSALGPQSSLLRSSEIQGSSKREIRRKEVQARLQTHFGLDESQIFIDSFSCALQDKILLHGRLYVFSSCVCFSSNIFGIQKKYVFPYSAISTVRKRPVNAIAIEFEEDFKYKYKGFASFANREKAVRCIEQHMVVARGDLADESGEESIVKERVSGNADATDERASLRTSEAEDLSKIPSASLDRGSGEDVSLDDSVPPARHASSGSLVINVPATTGDAAMQDVPIDQVWGSCFAERSECGRGPVPASTKDLFRKIFLSPSFWKDVLQRIGERDVNIASWSRGPSDYMERTVTFVHPLKIVMGPKQTNCEVVNRYSYTSQNGVVFEAEQHNLDVPYGNSFRVQTFYEINPLTSGSSEVIISVAVRWLQVPVGMIRRKIESGTIEGTTATVELFLEACRKHAHALSFSEAEETTGRETTRPRPTQSSLPEGAHSPPDDSMERRPPLSATVTSEGEPFKLPAPSEERAPKIWSRSPTQPADEPTRPVPKDLGTPPMTGTVIQLNTIEIFLLAALVLVLALILFILSTLSSINRELEAIRRLVTQ